MNRRCGGGEAWTKGPPASLTYSVSPWDAGGAEGAGGLFLYTEATTQCGAAAAISETSESGVCFCICLRQGLAV